MSKKRGAADAEGVRRRVGGMGPDSAVVVPTLIVQFGDWKVDLPERFSARRYA